MPEDSVYPYEEAETKLVNIRNHGESKVDAYVGGETKSSNFEKSVFVNPFDKAEKGREGAVNHYKPYFYRRYLEESDFRKAAHSAEGKTLGCWCYPRKCHGEVIVDLLNIHIEDGVSGVIEHIEEEIGELHKEELGVQGFREYEGAMDALEEVREEYGL